MGRITPPFRSIFKREVNSLRRGYREALMNLSRRDAFDSLVKAWSSEQGAMSYARIPSVLDVMLLTGIVDNRSLIQELSGRIAAVESKVEKLERAVRLI